MLRYSPVCDVSEDAYIAYLLANTKNGAVIKQLQSLIGRCRVAKCDGGYVGNGGHVVTLERGCVGSVANHEVVGVRVVGVESRVDGDDVGCVGDASRGVGGVKGCSGDIPDSGSDTAVGIGGDGVFRHEGTVELPTSPVVAPYPVQLGVALGPKGGVSVGRGPRYARNLRNRTKALAKTSYFSDVVSPAERDALVRQRYQRYVVENEAAIRVATEKMKVFERDEESGYAEKKVLAWQMKIDDRIRTLSSDSSSRGKSAASLSFSSSVSSRDAKRLRELEDKNGILEREKDALRVEVNDIRAAWERELARMRSDARHRSSGGF